MDTDFSFNYICNNFNILIRTKLKMARNSLSTTASKPSQTKVASQSSSSSSLHTINKNKTSNAATSLRENELSIQILEINEEKIPLIEISEQGDVILDVTFQNSSDCTRSIIPKDHKPNNNKNINIIGYMKKPLVPSSQRICYRVKKKLLENISNYFRLLFSTQFAEGIAVQNTIKVLRDKAATIQGNGEKELNQEDDNYLLKITDVVKKLPRIKIIDEDLATRTVGRELIFDDILRVIHGLVSCVCRRPFSLCFYLLFCFFFLKNLTQLFLKIF